MRRRAEIPEELSYGPFTRAEARRAGLTRGRLQGADLQRPHHGVYSTSAPTDLRERCAALQPVMGERHWFSHVTAARLWGIPVEPKYAADEPLHVLTAGGRFPLRHRDCVGWVTARSDVPGQFFGGIPVVDPVEVWRQLAVRGVVEAGVDVGFEWLVAAGDFLVSGAPRPSGGRTPALVTLKTLTSATDACAGRRGGRRLREACALVRVGADSPRESILRMHLIGAGLPEPTIQVPVETERGTLHSDLGYPAARLLIEYQGDEHRKSRRRWLSDLTRVQLFQDAGYTVLLVGADDVDDGAEALIARVRRHLARENAR